MFHTARDSHVLVHFDLELGALHKLVSDAGSKRPLFLAQEVACGSTLQLLRSCISG